MECTAPPVIPFVPNSPIAVVHSGRGALAATARPVDVPNLPALRDTTGCSLVRSISSVGAQPTTQPPSEPALSCVSHEANFAGPSAPPSASTHAAKLAAHADEHALVTPRHPTTHAQAFSGSLCPPFAPVAGAKERYRASCPSRSIASYIATPLPHAMASFVYVIKLISRARERGGGGREGGVVRVRRGKRCHHWHQSDVRDQRRRVYPVPRRKSNHATHQSTSLGAGAAPTAHVRG